MFKRVKLHPYVQDKSKHPQFSLANRREGLRYHFSLCRSEHDTFCRLCRCPVGCLIFLHPCREIRGCVHAEGRSLSAGLQHLKRDKISQRSHRVTPKKYSCEGWDEILFLKTDTNYSQSEKCCVFFPMPTVFRLGACKPRCFGKASLSEAPGRRLFVGPREVWNSQC